MSVHLPKGLLSRFARAGRTVEVATVDEPEVITINEGGDVDVATSEELDSGGTTATATLKDGLVHLSGRFEFDGANSALGFTLPESFRPTEQTALRFFAEASSGSAVSAHGFFNDSGVVAIAKDSGAWANGDIVYLSGSYLAA